MELFVRCLSLLVLFDGLHCCLKSLLEQQNQYNKPVLQQYHKQAYPLTYRPINPHIPLYRSPHHYMAYAPRYYQQHPFPQSGQIHPNLPQYPQFPYYQSRHPNVPQNPQLNLYQPQYLNLLQHSQPHPNLRFLNIPQHTDHRQVLPQYPQHYFNTSPYAHQLPNLRQRFQQQPDIEQYSQQQPIPKHREYPTRKSTSVEGHFSTQSPDFLVNSQDSLLSENSVLRNTSEQQNYLQNSFSDNQVSRHSSQSQDNLQNRPSEISISRQTSKVQNNYQNSSSENPVSRHTSQPQQNLQEPPAGTHISIQSSARDDPASFKDATASENSVLWLTSQL